MTEPLATVKLGGQISFREADDLTACIAESGYDVVQRAGDGEIQVFKKGTLPESIEEWDGTLEQRVEEELNAEGRRRAKDAFDSIDTDES